MARTTIVFGIMLVVLGLVGYVGTGAASVTALIPAFFGAVLGFLGWLGLNERYRKWQRWSALWGFSARRPV